MSKLIYIDRSRIEADWDCPRKRWWNYEYQAPGADHRGVVRNEDATALIFGGAMHTALSSALLDLHPPDEIATVLGAQLEKLSYLPDTQYREHYNLGLGLYWGFHYAILPNILDQYDVLSVEGECELDITPAIKMMCRPDLVLQRKSDGTIWYPDFKTTGFKTKNWMDSWRYAVQLQTGCAAIEQTHPHMRVEGAMIVGLYKGYTDKNQLLRSPFTYAYHYKSTGVWNPEWCRGWDLTPVSDYPGGVKDWVSSLMLTHEDLVKEQFPTVDEITFDRGQLKNFISQTAHREYQINTNAEWLNKFNPKIQTGYDAVLNINFPQHFKSCRPVIGSACAYIECCNSSSVAEDPVGSRLYVVRQPHHVQEDMQDAEA